MSLANSFKDSVKRLVHNGRFSATSLVNNKIFVFHLLFQNLILVRPARPRIHRTITAAGGSMMTVLEDTVADVQ